MFLSGDKKIFAIEFNKDKDACQLSLYIEGKDILRFKLDGIIYAYRWRDFNDIREWFQENLKYILEDDTFPLEVSGDSAAELCESSYKMDFDDIEKYEMLQDWMFRHSWFSAREGSFLADVYFRKVKGTIEISWDNRETFKEDGIVYIFPQGKICVDICQFCEIIQNFISLYDQLVKNVTWKYQRNGFLMC